MGASDRSRPVPAGEAPRRALAFAVLWLLIAAVAMGAAMWAAIDLSSVALRIILALLLVAGSAAALMLASDSVERWLDGVGREWARWLQWLATSTVALAVVVVLGAPVSAVAPDQPGISSLAIDLLIAAVLGAIAGLVATGIILVGTAALAPAIWWVQSRVGVQERAQRWQPPQHPWRRVPRQAARGAALGTAGLLLSAVCTAVLTTATVNHTAAADTPRPIESSVLLTLILPIAAWFLGTGIVWLLFARRHGQKLRPHRRMRHGTHAAALSVCLIVAAAWIAAAGVEGHARRQLWSGATSAVPAVAVTNRQAGPQSPYLAQQFEPQLWLTSGERWNPTSVTWYVRQNPKPNTDPPFCSAHAAGTPPAGCYQIPGSCDQADPGPCADSGAEDPALYYRYVDASNAGHDVSAPAGGAWTVIQYWVFYNYDSLHTFPVTQWHQSDWEQVSVLVRRQGNVVRPAEVAFSEHCYGARLPAERVRWADGSHPVVFVARGSHANYPRRVDLPVRELRCSLGLTPRYLGVAGLFFSPAVDGSRLEIPLAYLIGLHDTANGARPTPPLRLVALDTAREIQSFRGNWGLDNNLSPLGIGRLSASAGPPAPQTQGPWKTPFSSMLCSGRWLSTHAIPRSETKWTCS